MDKKTKIWLISLGVGTTVLLTLLGIYWYNARKLRLSPFRKALIKSIYDEYLLWNQNGKIKEGDQRTLDKLREYWKAGGVSNWDDQKMKDEAWSAVFISYLMKKSGAGDDFKYSPSHSVYIRDAVQNRKLNNQNPFKAYKPEEKKLEPGDLVCYARQSGVDYDKTGAYKSHCDLVTEIKGSEAVSIGGNVSDSVTQTIVPVTKEGKIDKSRDKKNYFVVIKNEKK